MWVNRLRQVDTLPFTPLLLVSASAPLQSTGPLRGNSQRGVRAPVCVKHLSRVNARACPQLVTKEPDRSDTIGVLHDTAAAQIVVVPSYAGCLVLYVGMSIGVMPPRARIDCCGGVVVFCLREAGGYTWVGRGTTKKAGQQA
eukprot:8301514-Pyramimonas_sp.AAC.2